jgi:hypothetical protein
MTGAAPQRQQLPYRGELFVLLGLLVIPAWADSPPDPLAERLVGRECLALHYIGSYRSPLGSPIDRRPISTIVEQGSVRYIEGSRLQLTLEGGTELSLDELTRLDRLLGDRHDLRGFTRGEATVITAVKRRENKVEVEVEGRGEPGRRGRIVMQFPSGVPAEAEVLAKLWHLLLPKPPYREETDELRATLSAIHRLEVSLLADWVGRPREQVVRRVAEASLRLGELSEQDRGAVLECYQQSYISLSERSGIALVDLAIAERPGGRVLEASAWPHLPLLGDWESEALRAKAAFGWSTTRVVKDLARKCSVPEATELMVTVTYDYQDRAGRGRDRLTSRIPVEVARAYAEIKIGTREMAGRSEHRFNDLPLSLGEW